VIYLSGSTNDTDEPRLIAAGVGLMCQPGNGYHHRISRYPWWAADIVGMNGNHTPEQGLDWLSRLPTARCLFAVSPDAYPDAAESLRRGLEYAPIIRELGFPVAVVAQDGAERMDWPWDAIDCLFIGGEKRAPSWREWKESDAAAGLARRARDAGKWVHMGRVNTMRRLRRARLMGCLSVDGTKIAFGPDINVVELVRFLRVLDNTPPLPLDRWEHPAHPKHRGAL
jgi:hypothetical protein